MTLASDGPPASEPPDAALESHHNASTDSLEVIEHPVMDDSMAAAAAMDVDAPQSVADSTVPPPQSELRMRRSEAPSSLPLSMEDTPRDVSDPMSPIAQRILRVPDVSSLLFVVPWLQQNALPLLAQSGPLLHAAWPYLTVIIEVVKLICDLIPRELAPALVGLVMIFFGGHYVTTIAAVEAFHLVGWHNLEKSFRLLRLNYRKARLGLRRDRLQRTRDGGMSAEQEFTEKVRIILRSVDATSLSSALSSLWAGGLAAIATVQSRYIRTLTLGASIGEILERYATPFLRPVLAALVPAEYEQWRPLILTYGTKWLGVCIAWTLQRVLSAVQSSMRGAQMMTDSVSHFLLTREYIPKDTSPFVFQAFSILVAVLGVSWQLSTNFTLPFPLNIVCLPFAILEWLLTAVVSFAPTIHMPGGLPH